MLSKRPAWEVQGDRRPFVACYATKERLFVMRHDCDGGVTSFR